MVPYIHLTIYPAEDLKIFSLCVLQLGGESKTWSSKLSLSLSKTGTLRLHHFKENKPELNLQSAVLATDEFATAHFKRSWRKANLNPIVGLSLRPFIFLI